MARSGRVAEILFWIPYSRVLVDRRPSPLRLCRLAPCQIPSAHSLRDGAEPAGSENAHLVSLLEARMLVSVGDPISCCAGSRLVRGRADNQSPFQVHQRAPSTVATL
eukprot:8786368-Pyramimonas_sp.AAC.1